MRQLPGPQRLQSGSLCRSGLLGFTHRNADFHRLKPRLRPAPRASCTHWPARDEAPRTLPVSPCSMRPCSKKPGFSILCLQLPAPLALPASSASCPQPRAQIGGSYWFTLSPQTWGGVFGVPCCAGIGNIILFWEFICQANTPVPTT